MSNICKTYGHASFVQNRLNMLQAKTFSGATMANFEDSSLVLKSTQK